MKKNIKRFVSFLIALTLVLSVSAPCLAFAYPMETPGGIDPHVYEVCNGKMYHEMVSNWHGSAFVNGKLYIKTGCAWQCSGCDYVLITEGEMLLSGAIVGKWAGEARNGKIGMTEYYLMDYPSEWGVCNSTKMDGYKFILA